MSEPAHTSSNRERPPGEQTINCREYPSRDRGEIVPDLQLAVTRFNDSPDRGTIHPPDLNGIERMETWMSVDLSLIADLSMWR